MRSDRLERRTAAQDTAITSQCAAAMTDHTQRTTGRITDSPAFHTGRTTLEAEHEGTVQDIIRLD